MSGHDTHARRRQGTPGGLSRRGLLAGVSALLAGCAGAGDMLGDLLGDSDDDAPLTGKRKPLPGTAIHTGKAKEPVLLPQPVRIGQWLQPGGTASNVVGNPALAENIRRRWRIKAAAESEGANRLSAPPIIVGNAICVLDARATLRAFHADSGRKLWQRPLVPAGEDAADGFGGGICSDGTRIFTATGFGELVAVRATTGSELWRVKAGRPLRTAPVHARGRVFVRDNGDILHAFAASDGSRLWDFRGPAGRTRIISATAPAVLGTLVVCPFSGGDLVGLSTTGDERWRYTLSAASTIADIAARPVISRTRVYGAAVQGDIAALSATSGAEIWSLSLPGRYTPWLAGNYLFHLSGRNQLYAVHAGSGHVRWQATLDAATHAGPVMAGGRLILANGSGQLLEVLAEGGQILRHHKVGASVYIPPLPARDSLYVLDDEGFLSRYA